MKQGREVVAVRYGPFFCYLVTGYWATGLLSMNSFEELETWKKCRDFRMKISELTKSFPDSEKFSLSAQIKRSSRSITNNIAEGFGRFHYQENIQFCRVARGSLFETKDHLIIAHDENLLISLPLKL